MFFPAHFFRESRSPFFRWPLLSPSFFVGVAARRVSFCFRAARSERTPCSLIICFEKVGAFVWCQFGVKGDLCAPPSRPSSSRPPPSLASCRLAREGRGGPGAAGASRAAGRRRRRPAGVRAGRRRRWRGAERGCPAAAPGAGGAGPRRRGRGTRRPLAPRRRPRRRQRPPPPSPPRAGRTSARACPPAARRRRLACRPPAHSRLAPPPSSSSSSSPPTSSSPKNPPPPAGPLLAPLHAYDLAPRISSAPPSVKLRLAHPAQRLGAHVEVGHHAVHHRQHAKGARELAAARRRRCRRPRR